MRIVAFGDSYTYGHGLSDCWVEESGNPGPRPSKYAWPSILGRKLDCEVINNSRPGSSNFRILHTLLQTKFEPDDYCVIMWSFPGRDMLFESGYPLVEGKILDIGSWLTNDIFKSWVTAHSSTDTIVKSWYHVHHAHIYLEHLNIPHHNFFVDYSQYVGLKPSHLDILVTDILAQEFNDRALEQFHPGPLTQARYAEEIRKAINVI